MPQKVDKMALKSHRISGLFLLIALLSLTPMGLAQDARIKDVAHIKGVRSNQLIGFGLVVGLSKSGDSRKSLATVRATASMLTRLGMNTKMEEAVSGGIAAVVVTADLPAFARNGDKIDVRLSTVGDAKSLAGGTLLMTPLRASDSKVYAVAQGAAVVGQANGSGTQVLTVATIPAGGVVENEFSPDIGESGVLTLSLKESDFTTNTRVADVINEHFRGFYAKSLDPVTVEVTLPDVFQDKVVEFVAELEGLRVAVDRKAIVVLNERTGTVVMGSDVTIGAVAISHGNLSIQIGGKARPGEKAKPQSVVNLDGATVGKLIETMNALGVKPADLVGILQAIHAAGALQAELRFI